MAAKKYLSLSNGRIQEVTGLVTSSGATDDGKLPALDASGRLDASMMPVGVGPTGAGGTTGQALTKKSNTDYDSEWTTLAFAATSHAHADVVGDSGSGGTAGFVPAPTAGDAAAGKYLKASGGWAVPPNSGGTVTSVALSLPEQFSVSGSPVTGSGTLTAGWSNQTANQVLAGPSSGSAAAPAFRVLVAADIPPEIVQNSRSANYTTVMGDAGKHILHPVSDNNARTFTIDSNANVAYAVGTVLMFINEINTVTIAITSDTLVLAGDGATGSKTLAANGVATAIKITTTKWMISGSGLS